MADTTNTRMGMAQLFVVPPGGRARTPAPPQSQSLSPAAVNRQQTVPWITSGATSLSRRQVVGKWFVFALGHQRVASLLHLTYPWLKAFEHAVTASESLRGPAHPDAGWAP